MLDLGSELEVADFTAAELDLVKLHIENNENISFETMINAWRDNNKNLCISYTCGQYYHYDTTLAIWW